MARGWCLAVSNRHTQTQTDALRLTQKLTDTLNRTQSRSRPLPVNDFPSRTSPSLFTRLPSPIRPHPDHRYHHVFPTPFSAPHYGTHPHVNPLSYPARLQSPGQNKMEKLEKRTSCALLHNHPSHTPNHIESPPEHATPKRPKTFKMDGRSTAERMRTEGVSCYRPPLSPPPRPVTELQREGHPFALHRHSNEGVEWTKTKFTHSFSRGQHGTARQNQPNLAMLL